MRRAGIEVQAPELRAWALQELKGYQLDDELPGYRSLSAPLQIDGINPRGSYEGVLLSLHALPEPVRKQLDRRVDLTDPLDELEAQIEYHRTRDEPIRLAPDNIAAIIGFLNASVVPPYHQITRLYWAIGPATLQGMVGQVRTALTELVVELTSEIAATGSPPPPQRTKELVREAMPWIQVTIVSAASQTNFHVDVMSNSSKNTIKGNTTKIERNSGTVVAASANVQAGVDLARMLEFAQYMRQNSAGLQLDELDRRELDSATAELEQATGQAVPETGRIRGAIERIKSAVGKAAPSLAQKMAVTAADDILAHLAENAIHAIGG